MLRRPQRPQDWEEDMRSGLGIIAARTDGLARFMNAYARLAKLPPPVMGPVVVSEWIRRVVTLEARAQVHLVAGPELQIQADADQLDQLLINVLRNAVDAALETGGGVYVGWRSDDRFVEVWVRDEGPGIPNPGNLFVPFFTTKPGGSGIGLVLCRQIAEAHGGTLALENLDKPQGSEAKLRLPI
jgi:two-component system nitrogen regulation sensor histidine kinase NtrY